MHVSKKHTLWLSSDIKFSWINKVVELLWEKTTNYNSSHSKSEICHQYIFFQNTGDCNNRGCVIYNQEHGHYTVVYFESITNTHPAIVNIALRSRCVLICHWKTVLLPFEEDLVKTPRPRCCRKYHLKTETIFVWLVFKDLHFQLEHKLGAECRSKKSNSTERLLVLLFFFHKIFFDK